MLGVVEKLDRAKFMIVYFARVQVSFEFSFFFFFCELKHLLACDICQRDTKESAAMRLSADRVVFLPWNLKHARALISAQAVEVLLFAAIGMCPLTYFLLFSRLSPVQLVFGK
jgi:hypothetical protein